MKLERSVIEFEVDGKTIVADVIEAQLTIEEIQSKHIGEDSHRQVIEEVKKWFAEEFEVELSTTQAWMVISGIAEAFEKVKKKLNPTPESHSGTAAMPSDSTTPSYISSMECSQDSSPSEKSQTEIQTPISAENVSGTLSAQPPGTT